MRVFLSYDHRDRSAARTVGEILEQEGFEVLDPVSNLLPGQDLVRQVERSLARAQAMVVLLSPHAADSPWVKYEIGYAIAERRFQERLIPIVLKTGTKVPWILRKLGVVELTSGVRRGKRRIVEALRRRETAA